MKKFARQLRKEQTPVEERMWKLLRGRRFMNLKFRRQHPVIWNTGCHGSDFYILDFYCHELQLGIELDGGIHDRQLEEDAFRDRKLREIGIDIIRLKNEEFNDFKKMMTKLFDKITDLKSKK